MAQAWSVFVIPAVGAAAGILIAAAEVLYYNKMFVGRTNASQCTVGNVSVWCCKPSCLQQQKHPWSSREHHGGSSRGPAPQQGLGHRLKGGNAPHNQHGVGIVPLCRKCAMQPLRPAATRAGLLSVRPCSALQAAPQHATCTRLPAPIIYTCSAVAALTHRHIMCAAAPAAVTGVQSLRRDLSSLGAKQVLSRRLHQNNISLSKSLRFG